MDNWLDRLGEEVFRFLTRNIREALTGIGSPLSTLEEIRLRAGKPVILNCSEGDFFIGGDGRLSGSKAGAMTAGQEDMAKILEMISFNSLYAYQEEIRSGYITLRGGHRVGLAGKIVLERGEVKNIRDISGLNIRISREIKGCSAGIVDYVKNGDGGVCNTLVISPPKCGKTTILRDLARVLSDGDAGKGFKGIKVGIVDERSEIAACYKGIPQNDVGIRTDVLDGCPKAAGMAMLLRSMSPDVIITDEIGGRGDRDAVMAVVNAGVKIIASAHGYNISELKSRQEVLSLLENGVFERYVVLSGFNGPGTLEEVMDGKSMKVLYRRG